MMYNNIMNANKYIRYRKSHSPSKIQYGGTKCATYLCDREVNSLIQGTQYCCPVCPLNNGAHTDKCNERCNKCHNGCNRFIYGVQGSGAITCCISCSNLNGPHEKICDYRNPVVQPLSKNPFTDLTKQQYQKQQFMKSQQIQPQVQPQIQSQHTQQPQIQSQQQPQIDITNAQIVFVPYNQVTGKSAKLDATSPLYQIFNKIYLGLPCFINKGCPYGGDKVTGGGFHVELVDTPNDLNKQNLYNTYNGLRIDLTKKANWDMCGSGSAFCYKLGMIGNKVIHVTVAYYKGGLSQNDIDACYKSVEKALGVKLV